MASSLFNPCTWQSFSESLSKFSYSTSWPGILHFMLHTFFTQSLSSFRNTCPYHCNLFCCRTGIMSSNPSLSLNPLLGILSCSFMPHTHLTVLISACWSASSFSFLTGQVSLPYNILEHTIVDIRDNANLELVDKFWYVGDMLSVCRDADAAVETRVQIGWNKFRPLVPLLKPITLYRWWWEAGCTAVVCEVACCMEVRSGP